MAVDEYWRIMLSDPRSQLLHSSVTALADGVSAFCRRRTRAAAVITSPAGLGGEQHVVDPYRLLGELGAEPELLFGQAEGSEIQTELVRLAPDVRLVRTRHGKLAYGCSLVVEIPRDLAAVHAVERWLRLSCFDLQAALSVIQNPTETITKRYAASTTPKAIALRSSAAVGSAYLSLVHAAATGGDYYPFQEIVEFGQRIAQGLSQAREEGAPIQGRLIIPGERQTMHDVSLDVHVESDDVKLIGKLILAASGGSRDSHRALVLPLPHVDPYELPGFSSSPPRPTDLIVELSGREAVLRCQERVLGCYRRGRLQGTTAESELSGAMELLRRHLEAVGCSSMRTGLDQFLRIVLQACHHGCSIVLDGSRGVSGAEDLGIRIDPPLMASGEATAADCAAMASVDGALAISLDGEVRAFGCLLDGRPVGAAESRARGSRYNSAIRYTASREHAAVLVGSSDGGVTLIVGGQEVYPDRVFSPPHLVRSKCDYFEEILTRAEFEQAVRS